MAVAIAAGPEADRLGLPAVARDQPGHRWAY